MGFTPKTELPPSAPAAPIQPLPEGAERALEYDPAVLRQDPEVLRQKGMSSSLAGEENADRHRAIQTMNALRLLGPAIRAAATGGTDEEQVARFVGLLDKANAAAQAVSTRLGLDPMEQRNRGVMNSLERVFVDAGAPTGVDVGPLLTDALVKAAELRAVDKELWQDYSDTVSIQVSLIKATVPVWQAQSRFDFFRNKDADLEVCAQKLLDTAAAAMVHLASPLTPAAERRTLFQITLEEVGVILGTVWDEEAARARQAMSAHTKQSLITWRKANPSGLPIDPIWKRFREQSGRVIKLATLIRPQTRPRR